MEVAATVVHVVTPANSQEDVHMDKRLLKLMSGKRLLQSEWDENAEGVSEVPISLRSPHSLMHLERSTFGSLDWNGSGYDG